MERKELEKTEKGGSWKKSASKSEKWRGKEQKTEEWIKRWEEETAEVGRKKRKILTEGDEIIEQYVEKWKGIIYRERRERKKVGKEQKSIYNTSDKKFRFRKSIKMGLPLTELIMQSEKIVEVNFGRNFWHNFSLIITST